MCYIMKRQYERRVISRGFDLARKVQWLCCCVCLSSVVMGADANTPAERPDRLFFGYVPTQLTHVLFELLQFLPHCYHLGSLCLGNINNAN